MNKRVKRVCQLVLRAYTKLCAFGHPLEKKVLFSSFGGKQYSGNPRAISEKMHQMYPDVEIVWHLRDKSNSAEIIPSYVRVIEGDGIKRIRLYKELATSFCYVRNVEFEKDVSKRNGQFFVQTWHGDRYFKSIMWEADPNGNLEIIDSRVVDLAIAGSKFGEESYRKALRYNGEVLTVGCPRNDRLVNLSRDDIDSIKSRLGIIGTNVLLYAPTFKDSAKGKENVHINLKAIHRILEENGQKWVVLVRAHLASKGIEHKEEQFLRDVSSYPDMTDLLLITDMLITDYSSCVCDFSLLKRPSILAPFDIEEYVKKNRQLKVSPFECGLFVATNQTELENIIKTKQLEDYQRACGCSNEYFGCRESGNASEIVCERIMHHYNMIIGHGNE